MLPCCNKIEMYKRGQLPKFKINYNLKLIDLNLENAQNTIQIENYKQIMIYIFILSFIMLVLD